MAVLKLKKHDEKREIEFELKFLATLTTHQRFELMFEKTKQLISLNKKRYANRKTTEVIKREPH